MGKVTSPEQNMYDTDKGTVDFATPDTIIYKEAHIKVAKVLLFFTIEN